MIGLTEIVLRLREQCNAFHDATTNKRRVGGVAAFESAMSTTNDFPVPHCFVVPLYGQDVSAINDDASLERRQLVRQYFATIVCIDNSQARGKGGDGAGDLRELDQLAAIQEQLTNAFQGWKPVQRFNPVRYFRDVFLFSDNKRLWHQFEWYVSYTSDPYATQEQEDQIAEILGEMDDNLTTPGGNVLTTLQNIYTTYHESDVIVPRTWDDFWGHRFCDTHATPEQVAAHAAGAQYQLPIPTHPRLVPVPPAVPPTPTPPFQHGIELQGDGDGI